METDADVVPGKRVTVVVSGWKSTPATAVPPVVANAAWTVWTVGADSVTTKVAVDAAPSTALASATDSKRQVVVQNRADALRVGQRRADGRAEVQNTVSSPSSAVSPWTVTGTVVLVAPAGMTAVPRSRRRSQSARSPCPGTVA